MHIRTVIQTELLLLGQTRNLVAPWCVQLLEASSTMYPVRVRLDSSKFVGVPNYPVLKYPHFTYIPIIAQTVFSYIQAKVFD